MRGRLIDAWQYAWGEIWLRLEELPEVYLDVYTDLYVELTKALKPPPTQDAQDKFNKDFNTISNDPALARNFL
jgi:hypothetical protein